MGWDAFWSYTDKIGIVAAFIAMVFSFWGWFNQKRKERRDNTLIYIRLRCNEPLVTITLQGQIRRKDLTRAEVLGLLGMLPMKTKGQRYELAELNRHVFFGKLEDAQINGAVNEVVILITREELHQFDHKKLLELCDVEGELGEE